MREDRPFRRGMTRDEAIALLLRGSGTHFDPKIVELIHRTLAALRGADRGVWDCPATTICCRPSHSPWQKLTWSQTRERGTYMAYDQIKSAHQEVYALYEIARTFGSSLDVRKHR